MAKKKAKYLPGSTWQDVLSGRPVTQDEANTDKRRKGKRPARCRSCNRVGVVAVGENCRGCGGQMKPIES